MARPKRLDRNLYRGLHRYFVTTCTLDREKAFSAQDFCLVTRDELLACAAEHHFSVTTYCLMPDHAHLLLCAREEAAALPPFVAEWKQRAGFAWRTRRGRRLWQEGYWDRILRADDEVLPIARYIVENPLRAGLVSDPRAYPWTGSEEYSIEQILDAAQIDLWKKWKRDGDRFRRPIKGRPTSRGATDLGIGAP